MVLTGPVGSRCEIHSQSVTSVWVRIPQVAILWPCPNKTLSVGRKKDKSDFVKGYEIKAY